MRETPDRDSGRTAAMSTNKIMSLVTTCRPISDLNQALMTNQRSQTLYVGQSEGSVYLGDGVVSDEDAFLQIHPLQFVARSGESLGNKI